MNSDRVEIEAFMRGFHFAITCFGGKPDREAYGLVRQLARELFPPYDKPPAPTKASLKGMKEPWDAGFWEEQNAKLANTPGRGSTEMDGGAASPPAELK